MLNDAAGWHCSTLRTTQFERWLEAPRQIDASVEFCSYRVQVPDLELLENMFPSTKGRVACRSVPARKEPCFLHLFGSCASGRQTHGSPISEHTSSDLTREVLVPSEAGFYIPQFVSVYWLSRENL